LRRFLCIVWTKLPIIDTLNLIAKVVFCEGFQSSVGRAVDCKGYKNPSVTGSIPVDENFLCTSCQHHYRSTIMEARS
jgi:hypothetical protein